MSFYATFFAAMRPPLALSKNEMPSERWPTVPRHGRLKVDGTVLERNTHQGKPMAPTAELDQLLQSTSTTEERVRGLLALGLQTTDIASVTGVSPSTVRNWSNGQSEPRQGAEVVLDDVRAAAQILLSGGLELPRVAQWLKSRNAERFGDARPLDVVPRDPMSVLAAAHGEVMDERIATASSEPALRIVEQTHPA